VQLRREGPWHWAKPATPRGVIRAIRLRPQPWQSGQAGWIRRIASGRWLLGAGGTGGWKLPCSSFGAVAMGSHDLQPPMVWESSRERVTSAWQP